MTISLRVIVGDVVTTIAMKVFHPTPCLNSHPLTQKYLHFCSVSCDAESVHCTSCAGGNGITIHNKANYLSNKENILIKFIN